MDEKNLNVFKRFWIYQSERFPVFSYGLMVLTFTFSAMSYSKFLRGNFDFSVLTLAFLGAFCGARIIYPFVISIICEGIIIGTVLKMGEEIVLAVETKIPRQKLEQELKAKNFEFDKLIITKISRDPRHNSKIDYDKLRKLLS